MRWLIALLVPAIPLATGLYFINMGLHAPQQKDPAGLMLAAFTMLLVAAAIFFLMLTRVMSQCQYSGGLALALWLTLAAIPVSLFMIFVVMAMLVSLPEGTTKIVPTFVLAVMAQLVLTAPLAFAAFIGVSTGNVQRRGYQL